MKHSKEWFWCKLGLYLSARQGLSGFRVHRVRVSGLEALGGLGFRVGLGLRVWGCFPHVFCQVRMD